MPEADLLESCYRNCFKLAVNSDIKTIAFPAISTGVYAFPGEDAANIAVSVMKEYSSQMQEIIACCFSIDDVELYQAVLKK